MLSYNIQTHSLYFTNFESQKAFENLKTQKTHTYLLPREVHTQTLGVTADVVPPVGVKLGVQGLL